VRRWSGCESIKATTPPPLLVRFGQREVDGREAHALREIVAFHFASIAETTRRKKKRGPTKTISGGRCCAHSISGSATDSAQQLDA